MTSSSSGCIVSWRDLRDDDGPAAAAAERVEEPSSVWSREALRENVDLAPDEFVAELEGDEDPEEDDDEDDDEVE